ncbi:hypothetical protein [Shinella sp. M31]|uniref:hypothetical protein n=1 Tax=Shinella sp. M31 TaxID=3368615 RepID=UPI003BA02027
MKRLEIRIVILSVEGSRVFLVVRALNGSGQACPLGLDNRTLSYKKSTAFPSRLRPVSQTILWLPLVLATARPISPVDQVVQARFTPG